MTQLAAIKADCEWNIIDRFASLACPSHKIYENWEHDGYKGATPDEFKAAPSQEAVLEAFEKWIDINDIPLFINNETKQFYKYTYKSYFKKENKRKCLDLKQFLKQLPIDDKAFNITHIAREDVKALLEIYQKASYTNKHPYALPKSTLSRSEKQAVSRHRRANDEYSTAMQNKNLTECEKKDVYALTNLQFAFWSATGYKTFHTRDCPKLKGMSNFIGFKSYNKAINSGYIPCKVCKPTAKQDVKLSIPMKSRERENESNEELIQLCEKLGYEYDDRDELFVIVTPLGKWVIFTKLRPIQLNHKPINGNIHKQPRVFLSLRDAFEYIHRHDKRNI